MPFIVMPETSAPTPHAPPHRYVPGITYMITAGTYRRVHLWREAIERDMLLWTLLTEYTKRDWRIMAWAVLSNHYHVVAQAPHTSCNLDNIVRAVHSKTAIWLNKRHHIKGRKVWHQYWDKCLTYERSTLARLNYVHNNPVKHGYVQSARDYRWCSMEWLIESLEPARAKAVLDTPYDRINVRDEF